MVDEDDEDEDEDDVVVDDDAPSFLACLIIQSNALSILVMFLQLLS